MEGDVAYLCFRVVMGMVANPPHGNSNSWNRKAGRFVRHPMA